MSLCLAGSLAHAGFVDTDWKVDGDQRAVLHEETGIEWLKLDETIGMSINGVSAQLDSTYSGWRLPTRSEVNAIFTALTGFDATTTGSYSLQSAANYLPARNFANVMGINYVASTFDYSTALHVNDDPRVGDSQVLMSGTVTNDNEQRGILYDDYNYSNDLNFSKTFLSVFLVSDGGTTYSSINDPSLNANNAASNSASNVSAPMAFGVIGLGFLGAAFARKRSNRKTA